MAQIDFPPSPSLNQTFTAQNGIDYVVVQINPVVWQVVEQSADTGQRLWTRDGGSGEIYPVFAGDDVVVKDTAGNKTTVITSGPVGSVKTDNLLFAHMPSLP